MLLINNIQLEDMIKHEQEWLVMYAFNPNEYEKQNGIYVSRVGANIALPHYHIGPRVTPYYYLLCVLEGEGTFIQQGKTYKLQKNDIFCLFPQVIHEYYCDAKQPIKKLILAFSGRQALNSLAQIGLSPQKPHSANRVSDEMINAFLHLFKHHENAMTRLKGLYSIFQSLSEHHPTATKEEQTNNWLIEGKHYIDHYFSEAITIEQIADKVGIERTHFTKMFTKHFKQSPMQYILQLRMNEAALLLEHTNYQIIEIAHAVGYQDISSFSKAFKKRVGMPPAVYRQQHLLQMNKAKQQK